MKIVIAAATLLGAAAPLAAQVPDTAQARRDSIALVRELEGARADTQPVRSAQAVGPANPRMLPDISAIGDFVADLSPKGSTQEELNRFGVRELEIAIGANVDPYFRADFILGVSDHEGVAIEEAYATALALPGGLQARLGRFHMPFGKQNTTHRAELHTVEYPWVIQRLLGEHALKGTGAWVSRIFSPFGFFQELQVTAVELVAGHDEEELVTEEPITKDLGDLAFSARLRNYWDLSESSNLELSASALRAMRPQPYDFGAAAPELNAIPVRQSMYGVDLTYRWRPLQQGLYRSFIAQAEVMVRDNAHSATLDPNYLGPADSHSGGYAFARWQLSRRWHIGARFDSLDDPELLSGTLRAASGYLQWFPSEFSKVNFAFERLMPGDFERTNRILVQAVFAVGPHRPHPF